MNIGTDTRAIVTGASLGIGRSVAAALHRRGATVGLLARDRGRLERVAAELGGGDRCIVLPADIAARGELEAAVATFVDSTGGIDLLVANAGIAHYGPFVDQPVENTEQMVRVNVLGTLLTVRIGIDPMIERGSGHIVVVSSGAGLRAFPGAAVYGGTKAAAAQFSTALRHELSGTGISLTTVYPGEVDTDLHSHQPTKLPDWRRSDEAVSPEEVAAATLAAVEADERSVHVPSPVRLLGLAGIAPRLVDRLLRRMRGPTAAPRRD